MRIVKQTLFIPVAAEARKNVSILVRMSRIEADEIKEMAKVRNLSVSEFMRRAAHGRRAESDYDTQIVLQLSKVVHAIRVIHKGMMELKMKPPEELWSPLIDEAIDAMLRIKN